MYIFGKNCKHILFSAWRANKLISLLKFLPDHDNNICFPADLFAPQLKLYYQQQTQKRLVCLTLLVFYLDIITIPVSVMC